MSTFLKGTRATHPMQLVAGRRPPNWSLNLFLKDQYLEDVKRQCDYCPDDVEPRGRMELIKLPNGLFICADHPSGPDRDKLNRYTES